MGRHTDGLIMKHGWPPNRHTEDSSISENLIMLIIYRVLPTCLEVCIDFEPVVGFPHRPAAGHLVTGTTNDEQAL